MDWKIKIWHQLVNTIKTGSRYGTNSQKKRRKNLDFSMNFSVHFQNYQNVSWFRFLINLGSGHAIALKSYDFAETSFLSTNDRFIYRTKNKYIEADCLGATVAGWNFYDQKLWNYSDTFFLLLLSRLGKSKNFHRFFFPLVKSSTGLDLFFSN